MKPVLQFLVAVAAILFTFSCSQQAEDKETNSDEKQSAEQPKEEQPSESARPAHWGYEGSDGPATWAQLSPAYALCGNGKHQSPVNIPSDGSGDDLDLQFNYKTTSLAVAHNEHMHDIIDNGHTIQCSVDEGSTLKLKGTTYSLKQFHFHTPSEHAIDGKNLPMEMHMVHQSDDGKLAVVSVLFEVGDKANDNIQLIVDNLPGAKGETNVVEGENVVLDAHLPKDKAAYHYIGSLTTPPCSEEVQWVVMKKRASVTKAQVSAISNRIGSNNRPVQPLNDREVVLTDI